VVFYMTFNGRRFTNECLTGEPLRLSSLNIKCISKVKPRGPQLLFSKNSVILSTAVMSQCMRNNHVLVRNHPTILWAPRLIGPLQISTSKLPCYKMRHQRRPRHTCFSRLVAIHITLTTEQWIDVQGHSRSSTSIAIESPYMTSY